MDYRDWAELNMNLMTMAKKPAATLSIEFKEAQTLYLPQQPLPVDVADLKPFDPLIIPLVSNSL